MVTAPLVRLTCVVGQPKSFLLIFPSFIEVVIM